MHPVEMVFLCFSFMQTLIMSKTLVQIFIDILAQPHFTHESLIFNAALICCRQLCHRSPLNIRLQNVTFMRKKKESYILTMLGTRDLSHHLMKSCII